MSFGWSARDFYKWLFRFESKIANRFCFRNRELSFGRWKCISFFISLSLFLLFSVLSFFFCFLVLFLFPFLWCINGSPSARLHNIALVAMHGSNYLLLMDIPQPRGGGPQSFSCFCPVKPFFFYYFFFCLSKEHYVSHPSLLLSLSVHLVFYRWVASKSQRSGSMDAMRWERQQLLNISDAGKTCRERSYKTLPNNAFNGGHQ